MKKKKKTKGTGGNGQRDLRGRRFSWSRSAGIIMLLAGGIALIIVFVTTRERNRPPESAAQSASVPRNTVLPLPPPEYDAEKPINSYDPTSGKPISPGITSSYRGYTIGHCCYNSKLKWDALEPGEKEAFIMRFVKK